MCLNWRHRAGLVDQWSRVTLALTARLLMFMSGPNFPQMSIGKGLFVLVILLNQGKIFFEDCISVSFWKDTKLSDFSYLNFRHGQQSDPTGDVLRLHRSNLVPISSLVGKSG